MRANYWVKRHQSGVMRDPRCIMRTPEPDEGTVRVRGSVADGAGNGEETRRGSDCFEQCCGN